MRLRSGLIPSGITITHRYPLIAATAAHAIPALPVVHSITLILGVSSPRRSASVSMRA